MKKQEKQEKPEKREKQEKQEKQEKPEKQQKTDLPLCTIYRVLASAEILMKSRQLLLKIFNMISSKDSGI